MAKKDKREVVDAVTVTLDEQEAMMIDVLRFSKYSKYFKKNRSELIRTLISEAHAEWRKSEIKENE